MALVVLVRGLNVGGHRRFRPSMLAGQLRRFDAVNIGATGTFVIRRPVSRAQLRLEVARRLPFDAEIMICDGRDILRLVSLDFFAGYPARPDLVHFVSLLSRPPRPAPLLPMQLPSGDGKWVLQVLALHGRFALGMYRREMRAIRYLGELDGLFGAPVTTRSWNTITAIAKALGWRPHD